MSVFAQYYENCIFGLQGCDSQVSASEMSCTESMSSCQSLEHGSVPEILVGLLYNATTGRLSAEVIKGSHFKNLAANRPPSECKRVLIQMLFILTGTFSIRGFSPVIVVLTSQIQMVNHQLICFMFSISSLLGSRKI